jgi:hypothetical protein
MVSLGQSRIRHWPAFRAYCLLFVSEHPFELESFDDSWRKGPFSIQYPVEVDTVDPRPPSPGRLTASPIYFFV